MVRIEEAIELQKARRRVKNEKEGKPLHEGLISKANLARILWPTHSSGAARTRMSDLISKSKTVRPEWIKLISIETGTDPNFLFGFKSKHDRDYQRLVVEDEQGIGF
jgi:hypothetical protein